MCNKLMTYRILKMLIQTLGSMNTNMKDDKKKG